jgi:hypothetical protein
MTELVVSERADARAPVHNVGVDPYVAFQPAAPTLNAVAEMKRVFRWHSAARYVPLDDDEQAKEVLAMVPAEERLAEVKTLFHSAEFSDAGEAFLHVAVGAMLAAENTVNNTYRFAISDSIYNDDEVWNGYQPGFSCPVIVRSIRQARLLGALPTCGEFIAMCVKHRAQFRTWRLNIETLVGLRYRAQTILGDLGPDDPNWIPF